MKHAVLVMAHRDLARLPDLLDSFDGDCRVYLHIDRKAAVDEEALRRIGMHPLVRKVGREYAVHWAGRSLVDCILWLCRMALEDGPDTAYFHLVSGADLMLRPVRDFKRFFDCCGGLNFLEYFRLPDRRWAEGGLDRLEWYHPLDRMEAREEQGLRFYKWYLEYQKRYGRRRPLPEYAVYGGSTWWSLTWEAVDYICAHYNWNGWYDRLAHTYAPDEMFVQTLLLHSPLAHTLVNDNLRYICWESRGGNCPAVLDLSDLPGMLRSEAFFARKIEWPVSRKLAGIIRFLKRQPMAAPLPEQPGERADAIARKLYREAESFPLAGLMNGRAGACIFLFYYGKLAGQPVYTEKAMSLMRGIIDRLHEVDHNDYANGSMGIATAILLLRNEGFVEADTDRLLAKVDRFVQASVSLMEEKGTTDKAVMRYFRFDLYLRMKQKLVQADAACRKMDFVLSTPGMSGYAGEGLQALHALYTGKCIHPVVFFDVSFS